MTTLQSRITGSILGMAYGDALGAETEFLNIKGIYERFPPRGPMMLYGEPARVTDDTQMALALGEALLTAPRPYESDALAEAIIAEFVKWYDDPDNNRAPGNTCLSACEGLIEGVLWRDASQINSKGCGANMRVMPVGLLPVDAAQRAKIAQLQAGITHGHPTALAASDLTAFTVAAILNGAEPYMLPKLVREYAESQRGNYHEDWLGDLWHRVPIMNDGTHYSTYGWDECLHVLDKLERAAIRADRDEDPCLATGGGWVADEAFATALLCFLLFPDDPVDTIRRAAVSSGDSDSIACIAGAFAGAYHGSEGWSAAWLEQIEYRPRLEKLAAGMIALHPA